MAKPTVDELMAADSWLNRSLAACVAVFLAGVVWLYLQSHDTRATDTGVMGIVFFVLLVLCYVGFAFAAGRAARLLGDAGWKYVAWILAAPFVALLPIEGILSTLITASPLSIKFLLGRQLDAAIRQKAFED